MIKPFRLLAIALLATTYSAVGQTSSQTKSTTPSKKAIVETSFQQWQAGTGSPFELLSEDMRWTISGFNQYAGGVREIGRKPVSSRSLLLSLRM